MGVLSMRMTKQRKAIIDVFEGNPEKALSAEMIYQNVQTDGLNLSTVYRTVDKLIATNLIKKTMFESTAYYYLLKDEHKHFMICIKCQQMIPIGCMLQRFLPEISKENKFQITGHDLTIYGNCEDCVTT